MTATLTELRERLAAGETTPETLIEDCLARIEAADPALNAFIRIEAASARAAAVESGRRWQSGQARALEGLPIAIKDNLDLAGSPTTAGLRARIDASPAARDAGAVARLRAAGAIIVGKLNMNEAALGADGGNWHFGACQNPLQPGYSPGGSSSGSAAAIAAGLVPASLGTDTMGSIRIPAAYCGIWGLKPSFGRISTAGSIAVSRRLDHIGPLATSAEDLLTLLDVLSGFDPDCPVSRAVPDRALPNRPRLGLPDLSGTAFDPAVSAAWQQACTRLEAGAYSIEPLPALPLAPDRVRRAGLLLCEAEMLAEHAELWASRRDDFSPELRTLLSWAEQQPATALARAMRRLDEGRLAINRWLARCDIVVLPTTPQTAFPLGEPVPTSQADLTCLANCAGLPALSLPLPTAPGSLPAGLQLVGPWGTDRALIRIAADIAALMGEATA